MNVLHIGESRVKKRRSSAPVCLSVRPSACPHLHILRVVRSAKNRDAVYRGLLGKRSLIGWFPITLKRPLGAEERCVAAMELLAASHLLANQHHVAQLLCCVRLPPVWSYIILSV